MDETVQAFGRSIEIEWVLTKTGLTVDVHRSLLSVTDNASPSNTLFKAQYAYGMRAYQTSLADADLGTRTNTVDALGEVTAYIDAKGQRFSFNYDALSRLKSRTEPDLMTTWTWGSTAASFNFGKLQSVAAASAQGTYSESYVYDRSSRLSTATIAIPGDTTYTYTQTYNATTGLLDTLQYPLSTSSYRLKLQYTYAYGLLKEVSDFTAGTAYWTATTMNPRGQLTQEKLGNGVIVNHTFDAVTGWVGSIQAGVGGGAALQNNSYLFDEVGNLTQRQDNNQGLTENVYYDNRYRLDHTTLNGIQNEATTYDVTGNVLTWSNFGSPTGHLNYTTPQSGCTYYANAQPHAVRSNALGTTITPFCNDANGNMVKWGGSSTGSWMSYNQPSTFTSGSSNSSQFFYNANHQRYKQIVSYNGLSETTFYVGGLMQKAITSAGTAYRHYIPAGSNTVLYTRLSTGVNATYYITQDHLGSSSVIANSSGGVVVDENCSASGLRRSENWAVSVSSADLNTIGTITRQGFTGQEMLDNVSLVNLNGRILIPLGSRMASPDPTVPDPGNTQSFNRYSYVNNNPLTFTDPSGYGACGPSAIPAAGTPPADGPVPEGSLEPVEVTGHCFPTVTYTFESGSFDSPSNPPTWMHAAPANGAGGPAPPPPLRVNSHQSQPQSQTQSPTECRASMEKWVQASAGAVGGAAGGLYLAGLPGALAGFAAGGATGFVTGALSGAGAPDLFTAAVGAPTGYVSTAFASQFFTAEGATFSGALFGGAGGAIGGVIPGAAGAGAGAATGALGGYAALIQMGAVGFTAGLPAYLTYRALDAAASNYCGAH